MEQGFEASQALPLFPLFPWLHNLARQGDYESFFFLIIINFPFAKSLGAGSLE